MQKIHIISGRLIDSTHVELDEPAENVRGEVQVLVKALTDTRSDDGMSMLEFIDSLPPGTRSKKDIDQQIRAERDAWGDR
jgi:hypothetical protein